MPKSVEYIFLDSPCCCYTFKGRHTAQYVRNERAIKAGVIFQTASSWQITTRKRDKKEVNPICETAACQSIENEIMCHFPEKAGIVLDSGGWKKMESENAHYFKYFEFNLKFTLLIRPAPFWIQSFEILFHPILTDTPTMPALSRNWHISISFSTLASCYFTI